MRLTGLVLWEPELRLVLSAYADDILLVVQDPGDLVRVEACQAIYSAASSARVNWVKSAGLAVGDWRQVAESRSVRQRLVLVEVTRVGDLLDYDRRDWLDPLMLAWRMGLSALVLPGAYFRSAALLPALSTLGKPVSVTSPLPLGCKDPTLRHIFSFCRQVQLLLQSAARDGEALKGSFLVPHQGARYRVYFSTGEARCYLCRVSGHVRRDCPLARQGEAPGIPMTQQDIGPIIADAPGRPVPEPAPPPLWTTATPAQAQGAPPLQCPDERESPALAADNLAGPMEEGVAEIPPGMGESLAQGESSFPYAAPPFSPPPPAQVPEPSPLPPDTTPANQPPDDAMEGWALV
ncbi:unnamed protein product [Natator depressus]